MAHYGLTEAEMDQLRDLHTRYVGARSAKDYSQSDQLRAELMAWGAWPPEQGWHPAAESPDHRQARLEARK